MTSNVRDFGAVGDGQTDDTDALLRAAEAVPASGGVLLIPAGVGALLHMTKLFLHSGCTTPAKTVPLVHGVDCERSFGSISRHSAQGGLHCVSLQYRRLIGHGGRAGLVSIQHMSGFISNSSLQVPTC